MVVPEKLKSRKLLLCILGALLPILGQAITGEVGWDKALTMSLGVLSVYLGAQGYADGKEVEANLPPGLARDPSTGRFVKIEGDEK